MPIFTRPSTSTRRSQRTRDSGPDSQTTMTVSQDRIFNGDILQFPDAHHQKHVVYLELQLPKRWMTQLHPQAKTIETYEVKLLSTYIVTVWVMSCAKKGDSSDFYHCTVSRIALSVTHFGSVHSNAYHSAMVICVQRDPCILFFYVSA